MVFDCSKLRGRIRECGLTQEQLAKAVGINKATLSVKMNGRYAFTANEMISIGEALNIPATEIGNYFFTE